MARAQGFFALHRIRSELERGAIPAKELGDGALILAAGLLLITPGVLTDALGLSLLVPPLRNLIRRGLTKWLAHRVRIETSGAWQDGHFRDPVEFSRDGNQSPPSGGSEIIDVQIVETHPVDD